MRFKIVLFFLVVLIISGFFILRNKSLNIEFKNINLSSFNFFNPNKSVKEGEKVALTTEGEIVLIDSELMALIPSSDTIAIENLSISGAGIQLSGKVKTPIVSNFESLIFPKSENDKLSMHIISSRMGSIDTPSIINGMIESSLQTTIDQKINNYYKVTDVTLESGRMILKVAPK
ncbi:MAG: hypothetical protein M1355_02395 [Patescibacteria group bacterium]|nr:hypothetical protein [Patescibacteria group bacterium]